MEANNILYLVEDGELMNVLDEITQNENAKKSKVNSYFIGINNLNDFIPTQSIRNLNYTVKIFGINGAELNRGNFREEASKKYYETFKGVEDPFFKEQKSLLWVFYILFMEDFALFIRKIAIAEALTGQKFHKIKITQSGKEKIFEENYWRNSEHSIAEKILSKFQKVKIRKLTQKIFSNQYKRIRHKLIKLGNTTLFELYRKVIEVPTTLFELYRKVIEVPIYCTRDLSIWVFRQLTSKLKVILRKNVKSLLFFSSKISIYFASKSDFVLIVDAGHIKKDNSQIKWKPYLDYFPDLESLYRKHGKVKILSLRPPLNLFTITRQLSHGILPVWPLSDKSDSFAFKNTILNLGNLSENLYRHYHYQMPTHVKFDTLQYSPEIDFVKKNFKRLKRTSLILLGWDGRNRSIAIGLNELDMSFDTFQSALGSYDLSHAGINQLGVRNHFNKNGVPTPKRYFLWSDQDLNIMQRLGFQTTEFVISGSLRLSAERIKGHIEKTSFYDRHFGKEFRRVFVWAPVLSALNTPVVLKKRHEDIFQIFFSKLQPTDCIIIKPWPGAQDCDFESIANRYENVAMWNPEPGWTNSDLLNLTHGVIGTFSSFLLEANLAGCRVLILNFPEARNYFDFETYRKFLELFQSVATNSELSNFDLNSWERVNLTPTDSGMFREFRID